MKFHRPIYNYFHLNTLRTGHATLRFYGPAAADRPRKFALAPHSLMASGGGSLWEVIYGYSVRDLALITEEMVFVGLEAKRFHQSKVVASWRTQQSACLFAMKKLVNF
jgi:hypothetical protein